MFKENPVYMSLAHQNHDKHTNNLVLPDKRLCCVQIESRIQHQNMLNIEKEEL